MKPIWYGLTIVVACCVFGVSIIQARDPGSECRKEEGQSFPCGGDAPNGDADGSPLEGCTQKLKWNSQTQYECVRPGAKIIRCSALDLVVSYCTATEANTDCDKAELNKTDCGVQENAMCTYNQAENRCEKKRVSGVENDPTCRVQQCVGTNERD